MKELMTEDITVRPDEVHIHILRMNREERAGAADRFLTLLPRDERDEYFCLEREDRRLEFLWSRLLLRFLLAGYLKKEILDLKFDVLANGKPFLVDSGLRFNLSHTTDFIACSFSRRETGIDIEKMENGPKSQAFRELIAKRFFTVGEIDCLLSCSDHSQERFFYQIFTIKEAHAKAVGGGLGLFTKGLPLSLPPLERFRSGNWEFLIRTREDYCLAHAVENAGKNFYQYRTFEWNGTALMEALEKRGTEQPAWKKKVATTPLSLARA